MTSKITDAIEQLNNGVDSLVGALPTFAESITDKEEQIIALRSEYFTAHPEAIAGVWVVDVDDLGNHTRLTGWGYDDEHWETVGNDAGNALRVALAYKLGGEPHLNIKIPHNGNDQSEVSMSIHAGYMIIDFHNFSEADTFHFLKEHNITLDTSELDKRLDGFNSRIQNLNSIKDSIVNAGLTDVPPDQMFVDCTAYDTAPITEEMLIRAPAGDDVKTIDVGAAYWNMLQAAMAELYGTINYVVEQDNPLFAEVIHRLGRLDGMLRTCSKEFEDNWMENNEKD